MFELELREKVFLMFEIMYRPFNGKMEFIHIRIYQI